MTKTDRGGTFWKKKKGIEQQCSSIEKAAMTQQTKIFDILVGAMAKKLRNSVKQNQEIFRSNRVIES
jgi:hypothetical protein